MAKRVVKCSFPQLPLSQSQLERYFRKPFKVNDILRQQHAVADPGFRGGRDFNTRGELTFFWIFFPENCMNKNGSGPEGEGRTSLVSLSSP